MWDVHFSLSLASASTRCIFLCWTVSVSLSHFILSLSVLNVSFATSWTTQSYCALVLPLCLCARQIFFSPLLLCVSTSWFRLSSFFFPSITSITYHGIYMTNLSISWSSSTSIVIPIEFRTCQHSHIFHELKSFTSFKPSTLFHICSSYCFFLWHIHFRSLLCKWLFVSLSCHTIFDCGFAHLGMQFGLFAVCCSRHKNTMWYLLENEKWWNATGRLLITIWPQSKEFIAWTINSFFGELFDCLCDCEAQIV